MGKIPISCQRKKPALKPIAVTTGASLPCPKETFRPERPALPSLCSSLEDGSGAYAEISPPESGTG